MSESQHGLFRQLCDFSEIIALWQAYFDESERESGVFGVAGYAFVPQQAKKFTKEWKNLLADYPGGLHMRDLTHRSREFKGISV